MLEQLAPLVQEFTTKVETRERYTLDVSRRNPEFADPSKPLPDRPVHREWKTRERGLLEQLSRGIGDHPSVRVRAEQLTVVSWCNLRSRKVRHALVLAESVSATKLLDAAPVSAVAPSTAAASDRATTSWRTSTANEASIRPAGGRSRKPGSRPPGSLSVLEEFVLVVTGIQTLRADVRRAAGRTAGGRVGPATALREVVDLLREVDGRGEPVVPEALVDRALRLLRSWRSTSRVALGYDIEVIELPHRHCLECGGKLVVRKDASSDVWCRPLDGRYIQGPALEGQPWPIPHESCGAVWPRNTWIQLLQDHPYDERRRA